MAGPAPTFADTWTRFGREIKATNEHAKWAAENGTNFVDLYAAIKAGTSGVPGLDGEYLTQAGTENMRAQVAAPLSPNALRDRFRPYLRELGRVIESVDIDDYGILRRLRDYMVANSQSLNSRAMTLDTSSSGSPTGNGTVHRLTVDEDAFALECTGPEVKTLTCVRDQASGARKHEEVFEFTGVAREKDGCQWLGSGTRRTIVASHAFSSPRLLTNPSFETHDATADDTAPGSTTGITGWTIGSAAANIKMRSSATAANVYRDYPGAPSTHWSVQFIASDSLTQVLRTQNPAVNFEPGGIKVPYFLAVAYKRKSSATGTLTLHLGSQTTAATIGSATNDVWNILVITVGQKNWYKTFKEADVDVKIDVASLATGTLIVDDVVLVPFTNLDGTWWVVLGGDTAFIRRDTLTFTDTDGTRATFSYWLWRAYGDGQGLGSLPLIGGWLPTNNSAAETIADPA